MTIADAAVNLPDVVAEVRALYPRYEEALVTNNVETLMEMFWSSSLVMRFGATENLYGIDEIQAFRNSRPAANLARTIQRLDVVAFGRDAASVTLEFERRSGAVVRRGRQSKLWVRFPIGWKIVSAHVSLLPPD